MTVKHDDKHEVTITGDEASGGDQGSTLIPMLIGGLILVIIGGIVVMMFV
ncbi:hypothetical protein [Paenochrobactrum pullorum]